jgi:hypothetical protein
VTGNKKQEENSQAQETPYIEEVQLQEETWVDNRSFFETYTPMNILREIKFKLTGK